MTSSPSAWASLLRLPNVFTILADVSAAFLLVSGPLSDFGSAARLILAFIAGVLLYWAGMILNDVFDIEKDRIQRPHRPLPAGHICPTRATVVAGLFVVFGVIAAFFCGQVPVEGFSFTFMPLWIAIALTVLILLYDGLLKQTPAAAYIMGGCRFLSFLLGASAAMDTTLAAGDSVLGFPKMVVAAAAGFGIYVAGLTMIGRKEAVGVKQLGGERAATSANVNTGAMLTVIGIALLAFSPRAGLANLVPRVDPMRMFPLAIGLIGFPIIQRAIYAAIDPVPSKLQLTVKSGILTIIPLAACFAVLGAGYWGVAVFALMAPAFWLSIRYRVT